MRQREASGAQAAPLERLPLDFLGIHFAGARMAISASVPLESTEAISAPKTAPEFLFHGSRAVGALASLDVQEEPQIRNEVEDRWLFATHRLDQATLYALPRPPVAGNFMNTLSPDPDDALGRFDARSSEEVRAQVFENRVYAFASAGFEQVRANPREWVKNTAQSIDASLTRTVSHIDDAMKAGIQYFTLAPGATAADFPALHTADRKALAQAIAGEKPVLVWENARDELGMDAGLRREVGAVRAMQARSAQNLHKNNDSSAAAISGIGVIAETVVPRANFANKLAMRRDSSTGADAEQRPKLGRPSL